MSNPTDQPQDQPPAATSEYAVTITATVKKTYTVSASSEEEAINTAHEIFSVLNDGTPEDYDQETDSVKKVEAPPEA